VQDAISCGDTTALTHYLLFKIIIVNNIVTDSGTITLLIARFLGLSDEVSLINSSKILTGVFCTNRFGPWWGSFLTVSPINPKSSSQNFAYHAREI